VFGAKADAAHPDQGGSSFYIDSVHYFPNGFLAAADVEHHVESRLPANLFRLNPAGDFSGRTLAGFHNKNYNAYSFNFRMNSQATSLENSQIRIRELPSVTSIDVLDSRWLKKLPVYLSFEKRS
jgi:hypothetical protein